MPASFPPARYDLPWKAALTHAFRAFMEFFFSELCTQIDWSKRPRFRDKELASVVLGDAPNSMVADKLVEVSLRDGRVQWVLIHVEIQAQRDTLLARRVFDYNYRIFQQYKQPVASLVLLADEDPNWRPSAFHNQLLGTKMGISFATAKLLYQHRWSKERIIAMFKVINWMMALPETQQDRYWETVFQLQKERKMTNPMEWITPLEQMFIDRGEKRGATAVLERLLTRRFGPLSKTTQKKLAKASLAQLTAWSEALLDATSLKQVFTTQSPAA